LRDAIQCRETIATVSKTQSSTRQTFLTGLIGAPIAHSASPAMHRQAADALGVRCHYQLIEVAGAGREELRVLLDSVRRLGFAGVNVTFPYKEAVVDLLDEMSPGAAAVGAVNTIVVAEDRLVGHNTDSTGFAQRRRRLRSVVGQPQLRSAHPSIGARSIPREPAAGRRVRAGGTWGFRGAHLRHRPGQGRSSCAASARL